MDEEFLRQNPICAETLSIEDVEDYTAEHSGGLIVLLRYLDDGWLVKLHDSWGPGDEIVVHRYEPTGDEPDVPNTDEIVWVFSRGTEALQFFKEVIAP